jgi:hypothetical protein
MTTIERSRIRHTDQRFLDGVTSMEVVYDRPEVGRVVR